MAQMTLAQEAVSPPAVQLQRRTPRLSASSFRPRHLGGELSEQVQPVTILSGDELKLRLEPTIGETLNREPGVSSTYFGPGASRPIIRGLGEDRVRVLQDGLATIDASDVSPDHAVTIEPLTVKVIEVVRGPATLLYGPNTVGGAVNIIDNRIPSEKLSRPIEGRVEGRSGSADDQRSGAGLVEFSLGSIVVHLDGFKRRTEDIEIPGFARSERLREMQPLPPGEEEPRDILPEQLYRQRGRRGWRFLRLGQRLLRNRLFGDRFNLRHRGGTRCNHRTRTTPMGPPRRIPEALRADQIDHLQSSAIPITPTRNSKGRKSGPFSKTRATMGESR